MFLETMKWPEVDALPREEMLVICCISALEQHSLHLPMGTDYFIGAELVRRLEKHLPSRLLCLPTVWLGASEHHMDFAGTISASTSTIALIVREITTSIRRHGFYKLLFLNSHGGNRALLNNVIQDIGKEFPDMTVIGATYWEIIRDRLNELRESDFGGMGHACELETSLMLAISDASVDMKKARRDGTMPASRFTRGEMLSAPTVAIYRSMKATTLHGGQGDPETASSSKGERMLEAIVQRLTELCDDIFAQKV